MEKLSERELQVTDLIHLGFIDKEIGSKLHISTETVRTHRKNINRKLHARNAADITRIYLLRLKPAKPYVLAFIIALAIALLLAGSPEQLFENLKASLTSLIQK